MKWFRFSMARCCADGEAESYFQPTVSEEHAHAVRTLRARARPQSRGRQPRPAADRHGRLERRHESGRRGGKGESIWLGWFLHAALSAFAPLADARGEPTRAATWRQHAAGLRESLEREGWDGGWYRRAYFDDGTPLGSASSVECRIDSIAQSWGVISGAANPVRAAIAMAAVDEYLVRRDDGLVLLFTPPFDQTPLDPGYIKGYPPGIRENGGQYTHGAVWSVIAFAMLGDGDKAGELFSILNPINHANTRADIHRYKVEPYVACADVYSSRRTSGAADGPGTPARPDGCIGRASSGYSDFVCGAKRYLRSLHTEVAGPVSKSLSDTTPHATTSRSRTHAGSAAESLSWSSMAIRCRRAPRRFL